MVIICFIGNLLEMLLMGQYLQTTCVDFIFLPAYNEIMDDFAKHREELKTKVVEEIIAQFEKQELTREELAQLCQYLLDNFDKQDDHQKLVAFMNNLAEDIPFFQNLARMEAGENDQEKEKKAAQ